MVNHYEMQESYYLKLNVFCQKKAHGAYSLNHDGNTYSGEYKCDVMDVVVKKNRRYPLQEVKQCCTFNPESDQANFQLYEGDEMDVNNNYFLSNITIIKVPKESCETAMIDVTFEIDRDGITTIQASINRSKTNCNRGSCIMKLDVLSADGTLTNTDITESKEMMKT